MFRALPVVVVLVPAGLGAQTATVVPAGNASVEGNALEAKPFAGNRIRLTQLLDASLVKIPFGQRITELSYRRDKTALPNDTLMRAASPAWSIRLGNLRVGTGHDGAAFDPRNPIGIFLPPGTGQQNTLIEVYNAATSFPPLPPVSGATAPFVIRFKLARPFAYTGPHGLAIDHFSYTEVRGEHPYYIDAERSSVDTGTAATFGQSCPNGQNRAYAIPSNPGGQPLSLLLFDGPPQSVGLAILSTSNRQWGPFTLPLDLAPLQLPGCSLYVSIDIALPVPTFSNGSTSARFPIPGEKALAGLRFFSQWMMIDNRVNPGFPLAFSNGMDVTLGRTVGELGLPASFIYGWGNLARQRNGFVDKGIALVTRITYQ